MSQILEDQFRWTISGTTGGGKAHRVSPCAERLTFYFASSSGCTATMQIQACAGSSAGPWASMGAASALSTGQTVVHQFTGPLEWVRPYCSAIKASTDVVLVDLVAN